MIRMTKRQACRFLLRKHGLLGEHRFAGKAGALSYIRTMGCIQFDPVDVCGKNAELVLQSRVKDFNRQDMWELLYTDRALIDYPDKNQAIFPVEDWPYFARYRETARKHGLRYEQMQPMMEECRAYIEAHGPISSDDLPVEGDFYWRSSLHWSNGRKAARSVLEQMYSQGDLIIHHKEGARKFYDLAARHIPPSILSAPDPMVSDEEYMRWRMLRRIGAVGLMWDRPSDAWLHLWDLTTEGRHAAFAALLEEGKIVQVQAEGLKWPLYARCEDLPLAEEVLLEQEYAPRCEVIAPLDCLLWDRKLIRALFDFSYTWEIYTPPEKRQYGAYVLPIVYGERFAGRLEASADRKEGTLQVKNVWYEGEKIPDSALEDCLRRLAAFNGCREWQKI